MKLTLSYPSQPETAVMTGFLDLPPEIRNQIYLHCESLVGPIPKARDNLVDVCHPIGENRFVGGGWYGDYYPGEPTEEAIRFLTQPAITKTCRQVRNETIPIFYGSNAIVLHDFYWPKMDGVWTPFPEVLRRLFRRIQLHVPLITCVVIDCDPGSAQAAHEVVSFLTDHFEFGAGVVKAWELEP